MKRTQHLLTMATMMLLAANNLFAQGPNGSGTYYQKADGKRGAQLKTALYEIIKEGHTSNTYKSLWSHFYTTDVRPDGKVWDMYSDITDFTFGTDQAGTYNKEGDKYNREHSFPNSWFGGSTSHIAYSDLHHLYPTDGYVNNRRSNYAFGENDGETYQSKFRTEDGEPEQLGFSKLGSCTYPGSGGVRCFEPNDIYKGDFARTFFYMVTRYEDEIVSWFQTYGSKDGVSETLDGKTYPGLSSWQLEMLMKWAENDPVDQPVVKETPRNTTVHDIQHNRNPFIDYPGLERYIWGDMMYEPFSYDNYQVPMEIMTVVTVRQVNDNVMYNMAGQVVDKSYKGLVIMNGKKFFNK